MYLRETGSKRDRVYERQRVREKPAARSTCCRDTACGDTTACVDTACGDTPGRSTATARETTRSAGRSHLVGDSSEGLGRSALGERPDRGPPTRRGKRPKLSFGRRRDPNRNQALPSTVVFALRRPPRRDGRFVGDRPVSSRPSEVLPGRSRRKPSTRPASQLHQPVRGPLPVHPSTKKRDPDHEPSGLPDASLLGVTRENGRRSGRGVTAPGGFAHVLSHGRPLRPEKRRLTTPRRPYYHPRAARNISRFSLSFLGSVRAGPSDPATYEASNPRSKRPFRLVCPPSSASGRAP